MSQLRVQSHASSVIVFGESLPHPRDKLFEICPPAIEQMLGASVSQAKGHIATAKTEAGLTACLPRITRNVHFGESCAAQR